MTTHVAHSPRFMIDHAIASQPLAERQFNFQTVSSNSSLERAAVVTTAAVKATTKVCHEPSSTNTSPNKIRSMRRAPTLQRRSGAKLCKSYIDVQKSPADRDGLKPPKGAKEKLVFGTSTSVQPCAHGTSMKSAPSNNSVLTQSFQPPRLRSILRRTSRVSPVDRDLLNQGDINAEILGEWESSWGGTCPSLPLHEFDMKKLTEALKWTLRLTFPENGYEGLLIAKKKQSLVVDVIDVVTLKHYLARSLFQDTVNLEDSEWKFSQKGKIHLFRDYSRKRKITEWNDSNSMEHLDNHFSSSSSRSCRTKRVRFVNEASNKCFRIES